MDSLNKTLNAALQFSGPDFFINRVPNIINQNLSKRFGIRRYQQEAFGRFDYYLNDYFSRPKDSPTQLLFHMATGSGKTLIMAGLIIYLYNQGYRNFLFFVNSTNIIEKTRENFLNPKSSKYLFAESIFIENKQVHIREVSNFQGVNQENINIVFSTIQGLHSRLNTPKENNLTYDDFQDKKLVLISDEAHHINADTKTGRILDSEEQEQIISWEGTVNHIFLANKKNVLLEFTATVDFSIPDIAEKYLEKLIFDYPLKQFRIDRFSKEVKVLQADLPPFDRAFQGILLSQYRRKIFEKYRKQIKPVILFKSRTIKESEAFFDEFIKRIKSLTIKDLEKIKITNQDKTINKIFVYFNKINLSLENLISEIKEDFSHEKLISVNSRNDSEQKQLIVNSLEDEDNEIRAVFAVDKLNEGWDVLNLFDIVRLYDTRDAKSGKPGKTTMSEAQLIGRGARYCPFRMTEDQSLYSRKFDDNLESELRICEELYYHSAYNPRYIQELNTALEEIGIKAKETIERKLFIKDNFRQSSFFGKEFLFLNQQKRFDRKDVFSLKSTLIEQVHKVSLRTGFIKSSVVFTEPDLNFLEKKEATYSLTDFGQPIIRKALNKIEFYQFSNLRNFFPNLNSISEFISSSSYLGKINLEISALPEQINNLSQDEKLQASITVLQSIASQISSDNFEYIGTKEFKPFQLNEKINDKILNFVLNESEDKEYGKSMLSETDTNYFLDLSKKDWYVFTDCFGTSEEKSLIHFINNTYDQLKQKYSEIFLVRNERFFKLYNFADGRPIEPDFVLFLINHNPEKSLHYQVFIEPKGEHLLRTDEWKEDFLKSLRSEHKIQQLWKDNEYIIWGMPFYNEELRKNNFSKEFKVFL